MRPVKYNTSVSVRLLPPVMVIDTCFNSKDVAGHAGSAAGEKENVPVPPITPVAPFTSSCRSPPSWGGFGEYETLVTWFGFALIVSATVYANVVLQVALVTLGFDGKMLTSWLWLLFVLPVAVR